MAPKMNTSSKKASTKSAKAAITAAGQQVSSARKAAIKEVEERIERLEGEAHAHDGKKLKVSIPADAPVDETAPTPTRGGDGFDPETTPLPVTTPADKRKAAAEARKQKATAAKKDRPKRDDISRKPKRMGVLDAAAKVLSDSKEPMRAGDMITAIEAKGLWKSPGGKTPEATLYAAIIREIAAKGTKARFKKHDRGVFVATTYAGKAV